VRERNLDLDSLYKKGEESIYWFKVSVSIGDSRAAYNRSVLYRFTIPLQTFGHQSIVLNMVRTPFELQCGNCSRVQCVTLLFPCPEPYINTVYHDFICGNFPAGNIVYTP